MAISSYQVEWLLTRLRRLHQAAPIRPAGAPHGPELVELTEQGADRSRQRDAPPRPRPRSDIWPADMADTTARPPAVRFELERRAGSFMRPKFAPSPPRLPIPKMKR